jgi:predicted NUDIX family phosphoesterase
MSEQVLVFKRELFPDLPTDGFIHKVDLLPRILSKAVFVDRDKAEVDPTYKQIIPYSILRYNEMVFRYKRSAWGNEARLHGLYSIGVGGHVNKSDFFPLLADATPIVEWTRDREIREEFYVKAPGQPRLAGLLNDESNEVGRVHFGVIYEYWLESPKVESKEKRVHIQSGFIRLPELVAHAEEYENWSRIIITQCLSQEIRVA